MNETHDGAAREPSKQKTKSKYRPWISYEALEEKYGATFGGAAGSPTPSPVTPKDIKIWERAKSLVLCYPVRHRHSIRYQLRPAKYIEPWLERRSSYKSHQVSQEDDPYSFKQPLGGMFYWPAQTSRPGRAGALLDSYEIQTEPVDKSSGPARTGRAAARAALDAGAGISGAKAAYRTASASHGGTRQKDEDPIEKAAKSVARRFWFSKKWPPEIEPEDLVQVAALAIHESAVKYDESRGAKIETFLFSCAENALLGYHERLRMRDNVNFPNGLEGVAEGDKTEADNEIPEDAFDALPDRQGEAIYGRYELGESQAETAARMNISVSAVQKLQDKGIEAMRRNHAEKAA